MHELLVERTRQTKEQFGLESYRLAETNLSRHVTPQGETHYYFSMEWFPEGTEREGDLNPHGTASIEWNLTTGYLLNAIFVKGQTFAQQGVVFTGDRKNSMIRWVEQQTGLLEKDLTITEEADGQLQFTGQFDGTRVEGGPSIEIKCNDQGQLIYYVAYGCFEYHPYIERGESLFSESELEPVIVEQVKLMEMPSFESKKLTKAYAIEEAFVAGDGEVIAFFEHERIGQMEYELTWSEPLDNTFERRPIDWDEEVSEEDACENRPSSFALPLREDEKEEAVEAVRTLLRQIRPEESGQWRLESLQREGRYVLANVKLNSQSSLVFRRKIQVFLDAEHMKVINYIDNEPMLDPFNDFEPSAEATVTHDEAYARLRPYVESPPIYVWHPERGRFVLCRKIDCQKAIHATTGKMTSLREL